MMSQVYRIIFHLILCFVLFLTVKAQPTIYFSEKLSTDEGLGSNRVNDIAQDDNGFLWIATSDGLNRFDGTEVVKYYHQDNANSIPHNYVHSLKALPGNYLAIGTQAGLCFYNGTTGIFRNFYFSQKSSLDEYNNIIVDIETDGIGNCWAYSKNCIFIFNAMLQLKKMIPSSYTEADITRGRVRFVEKIFPLSDGNSLLYLNDGWHIYSTQTWTMTKLENSSYSNVLGFLKYRCSLPDRKQDHFPASNLFKVYDKYFLYIKQCSDSLFLFDEKGHVLSSCFFPYNKYPFVLWSQQVNMMDSATLLFSFHNYGVAIIPVSWQKSRPVIHQPSPLLFEANEYGNALRDRQGNWWLATTEDGLQKISPQKQYFKSAQLADLTSGKPIRYEVTSLTRQKNILWVSVYGEGFFEIDLVTGRQQQHNLVEAVKNDWINFTWNIRQVSDDTLWVGTQAGMFWYSISTKKTGRIPGYPGKPAVLDSVPVTTQFEDSQGLVWMGLGKGKGVCYFDQAQRSFKYYPGNSLQAYPFRYPIGIDEDKKGNLWFVSDASTSLAYWDRNTAQFQVIPLHFTFGQQVEALSAIYYDSDSVIWLGTVTGGLIKFNPSVKSMLSYGNDRGLINSHISSIYKDKYKRLWLATDGGLSCFDPRTQMFTNYTTSEGLPVKFLSASFYYDRTKQHLFNGSKGMYFHFNPDSMNLDFAPQKTIITGIQVNGEPHALQGHMAKLGPRQNDITIHYTTIDLVNGPSTKYAYQLLGEDTAWIMAGHQRQINFSRLAPGKYTFMVRASNSSDVWSRETASFTFSIRPPFTETIWFYGLLALVMACVFYGMYHFRLRQLTRTEQIRSEISRNLHDEVGSMLTNISLSSLLAQKQLTGDGPVNRILDRIYQDSQNVSQTMREIIWSIDPRIDTLGEALPRMLHYASELLEAKNIELQAEIESGIEHVKLSMQKRRDLYLIFKEAVNNLAKHSKATHVKVNFQLPGHTLVMTISDDGIGFDRDPSPDGAGLKNMQERAQKHHWKLTIQCGSGKGTTIMLKAQIA